MKNINEPEYVYETEIPEVWEIQCPESRFFSCKEWMTREELLGHYQEHHKAYEYDRLSDLESYFEHERQRRYGR